MPNFKSIGRVSVLAVAATLIGTLAAEAASGHTGLRAQCVADAQTGYNMQVAGCEDPGLRDQYNKGPQVTCLTNAADHLETNLDYCNSSVPEFEVIDPGVSFPKSASLDGWHPKPKKSKAVFDVDALKGADTSGGHGSGASDVTGGSNGGNPIKGNFNSSMGSASMSTGGGSGSIVQ